MLKKVKVKACSNIMVGGLRTADNFLTSEEVISGAVMRSGFATDILLNNPNYEFDVPSQDGECKYNYVYYDENLCNGLSEEEKRIYKEFSNMKFSFFYPNDSIPAPLTAKVCKTCGTKHHIKDIVFENKALVCKDCEKELKSKNLDEQEFNKIPKRMENLKGLIHWDNENRKYVSTKVEKLISTHTAINYNLHTARDGSLFSVKAIKKGTEFVGYIDDCNTGLIYKGKIIYVGKYSSNGFGKLQITDISDVSQEDLKSRIDVFNEKFKGIEDKKYISMLLLSDGKLLSVENGANTGILSTDDYNNLWKKAIFGDSDIFTIEKIFAQNIFYSGFDTSKKYGDWRNSPEIITLKGTSFKISYDIKNEEQALKVLNQLEQKGIGRDTNNGYGMVSVCHKIHTLGVD